MIDHQFDQIVIECDVCDTVFEPAGEPCGRSTDWSGVVWPAAKSIGWRSRQIDGEWLHFCPGCKP